MSNQVIALHPNAIKPTNDDWMVKNNNRLPLISLDKSIFIKTKEEKQELSKVKKSSNNKQLKDEMLSIILHNKTFNAGGLMLKLVD